MRKIRRVKIKLRRVRNERMKKSPRKRGVKLSGERRRTTEEKTI